VAFLQRSRETARPRSPARSPAACSTSCAPADDSAAAFRRDRRHLFPAREVEVLLLLDDHLATGRHRQEAVHLEHTVRSHVKSLLRKLSVLCRADAL
jgi:DNA-binding NarL/FixJ family response regulator